MPGDTEEKILVLGCGNTLLGDDGFGPAVAERLIEEGGYGDEVEVLDIGTSIGNLLFDLLFGPAPEMIVIVDSIALDGNPDWKVGEVREVPLDELGPSLPSDDFSSHLGPTVGKLRRLRDERGIEIRIVACGIGEKTLEIGRMMSDHIAAKVPSAADLVRRIIDGRPDRA